MADEVTWTTQPSAPEPAPVVNAEQGTPQRAGVYDGELPDYAAVWPARGGLNGAPQPWDLPRMGIDVPGEDVRQLPAGTADTVSPIVPVHGRPYLAAGSAGAAVRELAQLLAILGYRTTISRGENGLAVFDDSVSAAVERFRDDFDVREDPSQFIRDRNTQATVHIGPWTWEGLLRAAEHAQAEQDADRRQLRHARA